MRTTLIWRTILLIPPTMVKGAKMSDWQPKAYKDYRWIVADPDLLGGKLAIRGTRISVSLVLECLANGMTLEEINKTYSHAFPPAVLSEVFEVASELTESFHVAA